MARQTDEFGNPIDDTQPPLDPNASRNALTGGIQGVTDPTVKAPDPAPNPQPIPTTASGAQSGSGIPWTAGASAPSSAPAGQTWNASMASFEPNAAPAPAATSNGPSGDAQSWLLSQLSSGAAPQSVIDQMNAAGGPYAALAAAYYPSKGQGVVGLAGGSYLAKNADGSWGWNVGDSQGGGPSPAASAAPAPTASAPSSASYSVSPNSGTNAYNEQIRQLLLQQIQGLSAPTTAESPDVAPAIGAFNTQSQRDQATNRDALAERFYAQGDGGNTLDSGGFNTSVQQGLERSAGDRANFTGSTILQVATQKRQQLQQMLQTATNAGLTDAAQQIQAQIAQIDAQLRQQGLSQQNAQFGDSLGLSYAQLLAQNNRDALLAGLTGA